MARGTLDLVKSSELAEAGEDLVTQRGRAGALLAHPGVAEHLLCVVCVS